MVELEDITRLTWTAPVEVPAEFTDDQCREVADYLVYVVPIADYTEADGGSASGTFHDHPRPAGPPLFRVTGHAGGSPVVEAVEPPASDEDPT